MGWFLYDKDLCHERVKHGHVLPALRELAIIVCDTFPHYEKLVTRNFKKNVYRFL